MNPKEKKKTVFIFLVVNLQDEKKIYKMKIEVARRLYIYLYEYMIYVYVYIYIHAMI